MKLLLLMYLIENNNLPFTRPIKKIWTIKKIFGAIIEKNIVEIKTF